MGVTDLRPFFTQIIGHDSVNVDRIPTKVGTEIRLNEPFKCAKCQRDRSTRSHFMADFVKCAKRRSTPVEAEKTPKLWPLVSRKRLERFSSNLDYGLPCLAGTSVANLVWITELQRCENCVFCLPVNILMVWRAGFLGRTAHYRVS